MRSNTLISCAILLAVLVGVVGGGVMGGLAGYYAAQQSVQTAQPAVSTVPITVSNIPTVSPGPSQVVNLTLSEESAVIEAVKKVKPAVVTVVAQVQTRRGLLDAASGSGVIIDPQGYIVTNNHVIEGQRDIVVIFADGSKTNAKIVGADSIADLAVLKVDTPVPASASFGDSSALQPGQLAIAIGSPLGDFRGTVTLGVVSALNRRLGNLRGLIQTDAAINNGNSGGPLVNTQGQVIGINTMVVRSAGLGNVAEGLGFAIPSNLVREITAQLIAKGKVERPYMGITYQEIDPQIASAMNLTVQTGIVVMSVEPNTPAQRAGLQEGDIILAIDGQKLDAENSLTVILFSHKVGETVTLTVVRNGKQIELKLTLGARPN